MFNANHRGDCLRFTVLKDPCLPFFLIFVFLGTEYQKQYEPSSGIRFDVSIIVEL